MDNVKQFAGAYGWQLLAMVAVIAIGIGFRWYGRMLERQTRERGATSPLAKSPPAHRSTGGP